MTVAKKEIYQSSSGSSTEEELRISDKVEAKTIYERLKLIYSRNDEKFLSNRFFHYRPRHSFVLTVQKSPRVLQSNGVTKIKIDNEITAWEIEKEEGIWVGVVTDNFEETAFEYWFIKLLLGTSSVIFPQMHNQYSGYYTQLISEKFVEELKNTTDFDEWHLGGDKYFRHVVDFFTAKNAPIEAVLPAFPCKSSNLQKVSGPLPDRGEYLAIKRLINFSKSIKEIYPPGIKIWIVSDGHVFSDCVAVDDEQVDIYSKALQEVYSGLKPEGDDPIQFCSLVDLFSLKKSNFDSSLVEDVEIGHYLGTQIDEEAEICRKILVTSCDTDSGKLAQDVNTPDHPRLYLYRGFSRFMSEDLENHPVATNSSRKKFKKIVSKVAFEMIKRNDAYSNLVELVFPFHLRFSIHAHKNIGPKYGIQLLASEDCFVINSLEDHKTPSLSDLLHIPTPWHNSIVEIDNKKTVYAIKSGQVRAGLKKGTGSGGWNEEKLCFEFKSIQMKNN